MKTLLKFSGGAERVNAAIKAGKLGETLGRLAETIQPQSSFFGCSEGKRTAFFVFDLENPADMVTISETLFMAFADSVEFLPVADGEELQRGLAAWGATQ